MDYRKAVMTTRCALPLVWCLALRAVERNPDEVISRVTEKVVASAAHIPNYTCVESVVRNYYWPIASTLPRSCPILMEQRQHPTPDLALRLAVTDRLHLDVTMTQTGEIFSWVGATRFSDMPVAQMVGGPMQTGAFGGFLSVIFKQDVRKFTFQGNTKVDGQNLMEYSFEVAPENSSYTVRVPGSWVKSGYSGTVLLDPGSDEVVHLTVNAAGLPAATSVCEISTNLDLNRVKIGDRKFLLPAQARQRFVMTTGEETENTTAFAHCREYLGESSVSFAAADLGAVASLQRALAPPVRAAVNQRFTFELTAPIASLTAAAGDAFSGRLLKPLRNKQRKTLVPAGSLVEGRLLRVERHHLAQGFTTIVLKPERVDVAGSKLPLAAVRDWSRELASRQKGRAHIEIPLPLPSERNAGVFRFAGDQAVVPRGYRLDWRTVDPDSR
jgi:hypothetical protein